MTQTLKNRIVHLLSNAKLVCAFIFGISAISLISAYIAQYVFDLQPCILCLYQRPPFYIAACLGLIGFFASGPKPKIAAFAVFLCSLAFLAGSVIAFYHTGVELHWWRSFLEGCKVSFDPSKPGDILSIIESTQSVPCDEIPWSDPILGLSMANYNAMMSFGLANLSAISAILIARKSNGMI